MKTHQFIAAAAVAAGLLSTGALAQTPAAPSATPNEVVYVPQLPSAADLTKAAAAQNITVERIDQTSTQITATYKYSNGAEMTVAYQPLSAAGAAGVPVPATAAPAVPGAATTTVVYGPPANYYTPAYYYAPAPYYSGWDWYPPISVGIGLGFRGGWGFHGGGDFHGGGGFHGRWR